MNNYPIQQRQNYFLFTFSLAIFAMGGGMLISSESDRTFYAGFCVTTLGLVFTIFSGIFMDEIKGFLARKSDEEHNTFLEEYNEKKNKEETKRMIKSVKKKMKEAKEEN